MGVINDILDFSKIEAGKLDIESTLFDLDKLVSQSIRYQSIKAKEKHSASDLINVIQELTVVITVNKPAFLDTVSQRLDLSDTRILVAEDNALNQKVALGLLKETHAQVDIVENGMQVIEKLAGPHRYDLVLMDIQMPDMDGLTACRKIREVLKLDIPIIAMTAHAMQRDIDKCREAGMNAHITKPIHAEKFYEVLAPELTELANAIKTKNYAVICRIAHIYSTALKYIGAYNLAVQSDFIDHAIRTETHETDTDFQQRLTAFHDALIMVTRQAENALREYGS